MLFDGSKHSWKPLFYNNSKHECVTTTLPQETHHKTIVYLEQINTRLNVDRYLKQNVIAKL